MIYGIQHITIKTENQIAIIRESKWIPAKLYEKDNIIKLEFLGDIKYNSNEILTLGEFKPSDDEEIKKLFEKKDIK